MTTRPYTSVAKNARRIDVANSLAAIRRRGAGRIVYLDSDLAEATMFFLNTCGVHPNMLEPVNRDREACFRILAESGVKATCGDILDVVKKKRKGPRVLWLDMEQNAVPTGCIRDSLASGDVVHLDLTCRAADPMDVIARHVRAFENCGVKRSSVRWGRYPGRAGTTSMVYLTSDGSAAAAAASRITL